MKSFGHKKNKLPVSFAHRTCDAGPTEHISSLSDPAPTSLTSIDWFQKKPLVPFLCFPTSSPLPNWHAPLLVLLQFHNPSRPHTQRSVASSLEMVLLVAWRFPSQDVEIPPTVPPEIRFVLHAQKSTSFCACLFLAIPSMFSGLATPDSEFLVEHISNFQSRLDVFSLATETTLLE
jgi:hypothetical protein